MTTLATTLQAFFTDRLIRQRQASPHTLAAYRDTLRLLLAMNLEAAWQTFQRYMQREGWFSRSFPVPPDTQPEQIEASHEDGVLTIRIPKIEGAREPTKRIEIH